MNVLARIQAGGRAIACGLATTKEERAAVLAQRFRDYQRKGYYRQGSESIVTPTTTRRPTSWPRCRMAISAACCWAARA
jgi:hypothetical protein